MAQWTTIDPNTLLPGDPWTSAKAQAAFENLEAVTEGAPGAPKVVSEGLDMFSAASPGTASYIDLDRVNKVAIMVPGATNYNLSTDNGSTFGTDIFMTAPGRVVSLGTANNAIRVNGAHIIIGVSGVKP